MIAIKNHKVITHPLGQKEIRCDCGWSSMNFYGLTAEKCPKCHVSFKTFGTLEKDTYCVNCGKDLDNPNDHFCWRCK